MNQQSHDFDNLDNQERKKMFNVFVEGGGKIINNSTNTKGVIQRPLSSETGKNTTILDNNQNQATKNKNQTINNKAKFQNLRLFFLRFKLYFWGIAYPLSPKLNEKFIFNLKVFLEKAVILQNFCKQLLEDSRMITQLEPYFLENSYSYVFVEHMSRAQFKTLSPKSQDMDIYNSSELVEDILKYFSVYEPQGAILVFKTLHSCLDVVQKILSLDKAQYNRYMNSLDIRFLFGNLLPKLKLLWMYQTKTVVNVNISHKAFLTILGIKDPLPVLAKKMHIQLLQKIEEQAYQLEKEEEAVHENDNVQRDMNKLQEIQLIFKNPDFSQTQRVDIKNLPLHNKGILIGILLDYLSNRYLYSVIDKFNFINNHKNYSNFFVILSEKVEQFFREASSFFSLSKDIIHLYSLSESEINSYKVTLTASKKKQVLLLKALTGIAKEIIYDLEKELLLFKEKDYKEIQDRNNPLFASSFGSKTRVQIIENMIDFVQAFKYELQFGDLSGGDIEIKNYSYILDQHFNSAEE